MAVATDGSRFGSTEKQFIVKRPFSVISQLQIPRTESFRDAHPAL